MKTASAKDKARRLQQWVRDKILLTFPALTDADVVSTPMGVTGIDVQLSQAARECFPYAVEGKNTEKLNVWQAMEQAREHASREEGLEPVVIARRNRTKPLAVMDAEHFFELVEYRIKCKSIEEDTQ